MKIIIIANRLPVRIERNDESFSIERSEGGLATGLGSLETDTEKFWVGWPGIHTDDENEKETITQELHALNFHPVFLSAEQIENYYEGYSNSTIWPLCHYFSLLLPIGPIFGSIQGGKRSLLQGGTTFH